jgi:hypothetical protein
MGDLAQGALLEFAVAGRSQHQTDFATFWHLTVYGRSDQ